MGATVSEVLRRFLPGFMRSAPALGSGQRRAVWAITHCRTPAMGGALHVCGQCGRREFAYHSCNHRSCPLCGRDATREWVGRELDKRVGAPYFMVTFTLPAELRSIFFGPGAKEAHDMFFASSARALREALAKPKYLGALHSGFTGILHTWNQRLLFHPHIHYIVPGAGIDSAGRVVTVKSARFLARVEGLAGAFRSHFREALRLAGWSTDPGAWNRKWGVHIKPFGSGANAIKYLGAYVCRTAIGDSRILSMTREEVSFRWKERSRGGRLRVETLDGSEFVRRYLRHVLPRGMKAVRYFGFRHPAAKAKRERVAFHTARPLLAGAPAPAPEPDRTRRCPCCSAPMIRLASIPAAFFRAAPRAPPATAKR
jgi:hypothetical protein